MWSSEVDKAAREFITLNHKPEVLFGDLTTRDPTKLKSTDIVMFGFPCQPFSVLGVRRGLRDQRSNVYHAFIKMLRVATVRCCVLENVLGLKTHKKGKTLLRVIRDLESCDFVVKFREYRACQFGLPQNRPRLYIVGFHKSEGKTPQLPKPPDLPVPPLSSFLSAEKGPRKARPTVSKHSVASKNLRRVLKTMRKRGINPNRETWAIDVDAEASP